MKLKLFSFLLIVGLFSCAQTDSIAKYRKLKRLDSANIIELAKNKQFVYHYAKFKNVHGEKLNKDERDLLDRGQLAKDYYIDKTGQIVEVRVRPMTLEDKFLEIQVRGMASYIAHDSMFVNINCDSIKEEIIGLVNRIEAAQFDEKIHQIEGMDEQEAMMEHFNQMEPIRNENYKVAQSILSNCAFPDTAQIGQDNMEVFLEVLRNSDRNLIVYHYGKIKDAMESGKLDKKNFAVIQDRLLMLNGYPQIYGSQVFWDRLHPIDEPETVNERRAAVGLKPIEEYLENWGLNFEEELRQMNQS